MIRQKMLEKAITDVGQEFPDRIFVESVQDKIILTEAGAKTLLDSMTKPQVDLALDKDELPDAKDGGVFVI